MEAASSTETSVKFNLLHCATVFFRVVEKSKDIKQKYGFFCDSPTYNMETIYNSFCPHIYEYICMNIAL
jgi:hypothetical protein